VDAEKVPVLKGRDFSRAARQQYQRGFTVAEKVSV
jgi:hypothetical protein